MKRLLAVVLICLLMLCGCKVYWDEDAVPAEKVEKQLSENGAETPAEKAPSAEEHGGASAGNPMPMNSENQGAEKGSKTMFARVEYCSTGKLECLTSGALGAHFDYEIFYYGIENFYIKVDGKEIELRKALKKDPKVMDSLYAEWKGDHGTQYLYKDGGSVKYPYDLYIAYKLHQLQPKGDAVYEDLILCGPGTSLEFLCELIEEEGYRARKPAESIVKRVEYSEKNAMEWLTEGELGKLFEYDIFYLGIKNFYITVDGKEIELRQALAKDPAIIDTLYKEWREDHGSRYAFYDGGSVLYPYKTYMAYRVVFPTNNLDGVQERDLVLCCEGTLSEIEKKIDQKRGYKEVYYKAAALGEKNSPNFNLDRYGWFAFNFGSVADDGVLGTYREENGKLILQVTGERGDRFIFEKTEEGYRYLEKESVTALPLPDGTLFSPNRP